jgi:hypothetical protein
MKTLKIIPFIIFVGLSLAILSIGLRLLPGIVAFVLARELAHQAGLERDFVFACAIIAAWVALAFVFWMGLSHKRLKSLLWLAPLLCIGFLICRGMLHNRTGDVPNPGVVRWFDASGQALLFYTKEPDGSITFSDQSGVHYRTGRPLKPVTPEIYEEWHKLNNKEDAKTHEGTGATVPGPFRGCLLGVNFPFLGILMAWTGAIDEPKELETTPKEKVASKAPERDENRNSLDTQQRGSEEDLAQRQYYIGQAFRQPQIPESGAMSPGIQRGISSTTNMSSPAYIQIKNATQYKAYVTFSSPDNHHVWPKPNYAFVADAGATIHVGLSGLPGEKIFFNARIVEYPNLAWKRDELPVAVCGETGLDSIVLTDHPYSYK